MDSVDDLKSVYPASSFGGKTLAQSDRSRRSSQSSWEVDLKLERSFPSEELSYSIGEDAVRYTTEVHEIPCAGLRIRHGKFRGLVCWRLVVRLPSAIATEAPNVRESAVVGNFILDTGAQACFVAPAVMRALGYGEHQVRPGAGVELLVQGVKTQFVIADEGEAGRLSLDYMVAGALGLHLNGASGAEPVIYREAQGVPRNAERTISLTQVVKGKVKSLFQSFTSKRQGTSSTQSGPSAQPDASRHSTSG